VQTLTRYLPGVTFEASSAISGEIVLPRLLKKMMQIISESAGAQHSEPNQYFTKHL